MQGTIMKPLRLNTGDTIGIVSPSDPITKEKEKQLQAGKKVLTDLGFTILDGKFLSSNNPREKAEDINTLFANTNVKAIICTQGGDSAETVLPYIDWEIIKSNPKIFMGISNITILLNAIHQKTGLITFHGNDICHGFGKNVTDYDIQEFLDRLVRGKKGEIKPNRERKTIRKGKTAGKLLGGNLNSLLKLAETEYWPDFQDSTLMLEAYRITKDECIEYFQKLKEKKVFNQINGVIIGYIYSMQAENPQSEQMEDLLFDFTKEYDFPILKTNDFGHNCPNTTLPIGGKIELDASKKTIKLLENCVN